jgi:hypothetical protein
MIGIDDASLSVTDNRYVHQGRTLPTMLLVLHA